MTGPYRVGGTQYLSNHLFSQPRAFNVLGELLVHVVKHIHDLCHNDSDRVCLVPDRKPNIQGLERQSKGQTTERPSTGV